MLEIKIYERNIETVTAGEDYIRGTVGAKVSITFDDFWADYEKTIVFKRCYGGVLNEPVRVLVNDMSTVIDIPPEIIAESGKYKIGMVGIKDGVVLPTFYSDEFNAPYGTDTKGKSPDAYTPSEIDQLRLSKQDKLTAGSGIKIENNVISASGGGIGGTTDYELLENKPQINGVELLGNKSLTNLGIYIPTKTSELENDSGFIDDTAFENYYTKTEVDDIVGNIEVLLGGI